MAKKGTNKSFRQPNKRTVVYAVIVFIVLIILIVVLFNRQSQTMSQPSPTGTKVFSDAAKLYYLTVPSSWQTTQTVATETTGLHTPNPKTTRIEISQMYVPAQVGVTVQAYLGTPTCPLPAAINTTLGGYPASYDQNMHQWMIPTTAATFYITTAYPGSGGFHTPLTQVAPTMVPQTTVIQDQLQLKDILGSFTPINLVPFSCK
jgi:hypothetical protein